MAAPVEKNYLSVYRLFLKEFTATIDPNDPLPVKVTGYTLEDADLEGEIIDWTLQYLNQKCCPQNLAMAIARSVLEEMQSIIKEDQELHTQVEEEKEIHYDPLRLMQAVVARVRMVCERYLVEVECWDKGNGPCPQLPPPAPGPPFISTFAIKNHRRKMEDRHVAIEDLHSLFNISLPGQVGYYAIFDGHHGHEAAAYSAAQLHGLIVHSEHYPKDPEAALRDAFLRADEIFIRKCASSKLLSGTTVLVALVRLRESLHVAWLGDSLGILVKSGGKIIQLVDPHTAERLDERNRIEAEGGVVIMHFNTWRINGTLAISRAIGDPDCKPHVSAAADVASYPLDGTEHFLILACDGLWDCVTAEQATSFVYDHLREDPGNHAVIGKSLVQLAKSRASNDNISVVVVLLSSVEDILATAPPPTALSLVHEPQQREVPLSADGIAPRSPSLHHLVNGTMDGDAAHFISSLKDASPEERSSLDVLATRNGFPDLMTSSFYGSSGEDGRNPFGDSCDLGPETDVDLLDGDAAATGGSAEAESAPRRDEGAVESREVGSEEWCGGGIGPEAWRGGRAICPGEAVEGIQVEEEEQLEGGSGAEEEAYDDSEEEEAGWKYVSVKPVGGGGGAAAAVSSGTTLGDEPALGPIVSEHDINTSSSPILGESGDAIATAISEKEDFRYKENLGDKHKVEGQETDKKKLCQDLDLEVLEKVHFEENLNLKCDTLEKALENQSSGEEGQQFVEGELKQEPREEHEESLEDSAMESRLNPDAAEFVPISPTRNTAQESLSPVGREFDVFRKEAEACPGDIFDEVSMMPTKPLKCEEESSFNNELPKNTPDRRIDTYDADVVLSSSFNCLQQSDEKVKEMASDKEHFVQDTSSFVDDDENKENMQECEDKENMFQHISSEFVVMSEELEEPMFGNDVSDSVASPPVLVVEDSFASKMLNELVEVNKDTLEAELHFQKYSSLETSQSSTKVQPENEEDKVSVHDTQLHKLAEVIPDQPEEHVEHFLVDFQADDQVHSPDTEEILCESVAERDSSTLDKFHTNKSHEKLPFNDFDEQSLSLTGDEIVSQIHEQVCGSLHKETLLDKPDKVFEEQVCFLNEDIILQPDKQMDDLSMPKEHVEHHIDEQLEEEQIKTSQTGKPPTHEVDEQIQPSLLVVSLNDSLLQNCSINPPKEENQQSSHGFDEHYPVEMGKDLYDVKSAGQENPAECLFESSIDTHSLEVDLTAFTPESVTPTELEAKTTTEHVISPNPAVDSYSETSPFFSTDTKSPMPDLDIASDVQKISQATSSEVKIPILDSVSKSDPSELLAAINDPVLVKAEIEPEQVAEILELVDNLVIPSSENSPPLEEVSAVEPLAMAKEPSDVIREEPPADGNSPQQSPHKTISESTDKAVAVGAVAATLGTVAVTLGTGLTVSADVKPTLPVEAKSSTKKATSIEKKKVTEKNKVSSISAATNKLKPAAKSPIPPSRTSSAPAKTSITSPTKVAGTLRARPLPAERKTTNPAAGKSQAPTKSVSAPLSSKPKTMKPSTVPTTRPAPAPRVTAAAAARPGTAGSALSKPGLPSAISKPASAAPKSPIAHPKVTEAKRTINGELSKASSLSSSSSAKCAPRKVPLTSYTCTSKPSASPTKNLPSALTSHKTAPEALPSKSKASNVINGTTSKAARTSTAAGSKPTVPPSTQTKKQPLKTLTTSTSADPKKAKESANKHISANRSTVGFSGAKRSTDMKLNVASKSVAVAKGNPEIKKTVSNGTVPKKTMENLDSINDVEEKIGLVISSHANGIAVEVNEVTKEEGSAVQGLSEGKEQVVLIVDEGVGVGEAM